MDALPQLVNTAAAAAEAGGSEKLSKREEAKEPIRHLAAAAALTQ